MEVKLITGWQKWYMLYSIWFMALLAMLPDIYNMAITMGVLNETTVPPLLSYSMKVVALCGMAARLIKQKKLEYDAEIEAGSKEP